MIIRNDEMGKTKGGLFFNICATELTDHWYMYKQNIIFRYRKFTWD